MILIGFKNCGKTTFGKLLAKQLGWEFIDTDDLLGAPASELYQQLGEVQFRDVEAQKIAELNPKKNTVIATGGGSVLREDNVKKLKSLGPLIYLRADKEQLRATTLPDFLSDNFDAVFAERDAIYTQVADRIIERGSEEAPHGE